MRDVPMQWGEPTSRRLAAYHEAGHAVAAFFRSAAGPTQRITIRRADLEPDEAGLHLGGNALPEATRYPLDSEPLRASVVVSLAGAEVDRRLTDSRATCGGADYDDVRELLFRTVFDWEIADCVARVTPEEREKHSLEEIAEARVDEIEQRYEALLESLRCEARDLVTRRWPHIEAVAESLLERESLSGREIEAIIERVERRLNGPARSRRGPREPRGNRRPPVVA